MRDKATLVQTHRYLAVIQIDGKTNGDYFPLSELTFKKDTNIFSVIQIDLEMDSLNDPSDNRKRSFASGR